MQSIVVGQAGFGRVKKATRWNDVSMLFLTLGLDIYLILHINMHIKIEHKRGISHMK